MYVHFAQGASSEDGRIFGWFVAELKHGKFCEIFNCGRHVGGWGNAFCIGERAHFTVAIWHSTAISCSQLWVLRIEGMN